MAVTRSGGNDFHGNLFWFHRNDNLDARNFFEPEKQEYKRNQIGATLGGPIRIPRLLDGRDRAWFFVSYQHESIREIRPLTGVVPTDGEREGRFSTTLMDPATGRPFPNNTIPADRINPVAKRLLAFFPRPNTAGALNFTSPDSFAPYDNPQFISRVDFQGFGSEPLVGALRLEFGTLRHRAPHLRILRRPTSPRLRPEHHQHPDPAGRPHQRGQLALDTKALHRGTLQSQA